MKRQTILVFFIIILIVLAGILIFFQKPKKSNFENINSIDGEIDVYKSLTCGCCSAYVNYIDGKVSPKIKPVEVQDINEVKQKYGIPSAMESCHTMIIDNYFIEGHVPLEAVEKLMKEKPNIKGIAMPGMPSGSPGMPGQKTGKFIIYSVNNDGSYNEWMTI